MCENMRKCLEMHYNNFKNEEKAKNLKENDWKMHKNGRNGKSVRKNA